MYNIIRIWKDAIVHALNSADIVGLRIRVWTGAFSQTLIAAMANTYIQSVYTIVYLTQTDVAHEMQWHNSRMYTTHNAT